MKLKTFFKNAKLWLFVILLAPTLIFLSACKNGLSAYDLAVKNGFQGTEQQWLESLKGTDGKDAENINSYDLYLDAVEHENYTGSYLDFLKECLTITSDTTSIVANKCVASVVSVDAYNGNTSSNPVTASGVIFNLDDNGNAFILTNYHATYCETNSNKAYNNYDLYLYGQDFSKVIKGAYIGGSSTYDISVLKVTESEILKNSNAQAIDLSTTSPKLGTSVLAIGNSHGDGISITKGVVSRDSEQVNFSVAGSTFLRRVIRHDAYITSGNSGGGLFDMNGDFIGLTNGGAKNDCSINYAIPASIVKAVAENIIKNYDGTNIQKLNVCRLGLKTSITDSSSTYNTQTGYVDIVDTVKISEITENSVAQTNGVLKVNDIFKSITLNPNTTKEKSITIQRSFEINDFLMLASQNDTIKIVVLRKGENNTYSEVTATITLSQMEFID